MIWCVRVHYVCMFYSIAFLLFILLNCTAEAGEPPSPGPWRLHGMLPGKSSSFANSIAFMSDGRTFAIPLSDAEIGVFRILPETEQKPPPLTVAQRRKIASMIAALDAQKFAQRELASQGLLALAPQVEPLLREARKQSASPEARSRLDHLLRKIAAAQARGLTRRIQRITRLPGLRDTIRSVEYSADNRRLLTAGHDNHIRILDCENAYRELRRIPVDNDVNHATFSPDGRRVFAALEDGEVRIWNVETGRKEAVLNTDAEELYCLDVSPDGRWLACSGAARQVWLWDLKNANRLRLLKEFGGDVGHLDFSPDSRRLACACENGLASVWDVAAGKRLRSLRGHQAQVWSIVYSPDGATLASSGELGDVVFWDTSNGRVQARFQEKTSYGCHVVFSPDSQLAVMTASYGRTLIWKRKGSRE